jgi:hypothetical protein
MRPPSLKPSLTLSRTLTFLGSAVLACTTVDPRESAAAIAALPPLPRSSIAAVLEHRADLSLTDEQVKKLQDLDDQLEQDNSALRRQLALQRPDGGTHEKRSRDDDSSERGMGGGMGGAGGGMGGMRGGGGGGGGGEGGAAAAE